MGKFKGLSKQIHILDIIKRTPIRHKITLSIVLLLLIPMTIVGVYFYWNISSVLTKNANENLNQLIQQTNSNLENSFKIIDTTSLHFLSNKTIRSWISGDTSFEGDFYDLFKNKSSIEEDLKYSLMFNNAWDMHLISTAYVFLNEDTFSSIFRSTTNIQVADNKNTNIYKKIIETETRGKSFVPPSAEDPMIYFTRIVPNVMKPMQRLVLIFGIEENEIYNKYVELLSFQGSKVYITDNEGTIYSCSDKNLLGSRVDFSLLNLKDESNVATINLDDTSYLIAHREISGTGLNFIVGIPKSQVLEKLSDSMRNYIVITLIIIMVTLLAGITISFLFTRFIKDLLRVINSVKVGNYEVKMPAYKDSELGLLSDTFNNMTDEIKHLINQVYEKQLLLKDSELKFLQSQMNPHFLFNTLITIGYKARLSKDENIYKMVTSLTELLQASIYTNSQAKVSIQKELEFVEFYLYLQKMRFEDRLEYEIQVSDDAILELQLPKLSIQPLVENAVVHGLEGKLGKGMVKLLIHQDMESIYFEIIDNGTGFASNLINLEDSTTVVRSKGHNSIGLINTNKRIKLIYGDEYGIHIESHINKGTKVIVHIPADRGDLTNV